MVQCFYNCKLTRDDCLQCKNYTEEQKQEWQNIMKSQLGQDLRAENMEPTCCMTQADELCFRPVSYEYKDKSFGCAKESIGHKVHVFCKEDLCNAKYDWKNKPENKSITPDYPPEVPYHVWIIVVISVLSMLVLSVFLFAKGYQKLLKRWKLKKRYQTGNVRHGTGHQQSAFDLDGSNSHLDNWGEQDGIANCQTNHAIHVPSPSYTYQNENYPLINPIIASPSGSTAGTQLTTLMTNNTTTNSGIEIQGSGLASSDYDNMTFSGSGSGKPILVNSTAARQVELAEVIGTGRFGVVWRGIWKCDSVVVKKFTSRDERAWKRERSIYETPMLRHANILGFITTDNKDTGVSTELWLITDYHRLGSLYEFLHHHALSPHALLKMVISVVNGLVHLHTEIQGINGKPRIAHRDLKSRNILVKNDGECCIGDMGFAMRQTDPTEMFSSTEPVGTRRYMAPEVLRGCLNCSSPFEMYLHADMYSLGLVMWEIARAVYHPQVDGMYPMAYCMPYEGLVTTDPTVEEMLAVVVERGIRPAVPFTDGEVNGHDLFRQIRESMTECWAADPQARINAMCVKKDLNLLLGSIKLSKQCWHFQPGTVTQDPDLPYGVVQLKNVPGDAPRFENTDCAGLKKHDPLAPDPSEANSTAATASILV